MVKIVETVKTTAKKSNKKSRYETDGYKRSEERKKLTRRINRLKNDVNTGKIKGAANISDANRTIADLERQKQESYINRKTKQYKYSLERMQNLREFAERKRESMIAVASQLRETVKGLTTKSYTEDATTKYRKNLLFQRELNQASISSELGVSAISKAEAKIFYTMTQEIWQKEEVLIKDRNLEIMKALDVDTLEEAYEIVMSSGVAQEAVKRAGQESEIQAEGSPDYITYVAIARGRL